MLVSHMCCFHPYLGRFESNLPLVLCKVIVFFYGFYHGFYRHETHVKKTFKETKATLGQEDSVGRGVFGSESFHP